MKNFLVFLKYRIKISKKKFDRSWTTTKGWDILSEPCPHRKNYLFEQILYFNMLVLVQLVR